MNVYLFIFEDILFNTIFIFVIFVNLYLIINNTFAKNIYFNFFKN